MDPSLRSHKRSVSSEACEHSSTPGAGRDSQGRFTGNGYITEKNQWRSNQEMVFTEHPATHTCWPRVINQKIFDTYRLFNYTSCQRAGELSRTPGAKKALRQGFKGTQKCS